MQHSVAYDNHTFDNRQFTLNIRRCTQRSVRDDSYTFESRQFTFNTKKCTQHLEADDDHIFYTRQFTFLQQIIHSQQQTMQFSIAADNSRSKPYIIYLNNRRQTFISISMDQIVFSKKIRIANQIYFTADTVAEIMPSLVIIFIYSIFLQKQRNQYL